MNNKPTFHDTAVDVKASLDIDGKYDSSMSPLVRTESVYSDDTSNTLPQYQPSNTAGPGYSVLNFTPGHALTITSRGIRFVRLPVPSSELEIDIRNSVDNSLAYTSTRSKKWSGNAVLSHPTLGELISTTYRFGPNREPEIELLQPSQIKSETVNKQPLKVKGQWTSRSIEFADAQHGRVYEWRYIKTKQSNGEKASFLALVLKSGCAEGVKPGEDKKVIAQLIRDEDSRTPGTKKSYAGNGGQLVLDRDAPGYMDESLIVATCIMMLKKEVDRRRCVQFAILAAMSSGGN